MARSKHKPKKATQATTTVTSKNGPVHEKTEYRLFNTTTMVKPSGKRSISGKKHMVGSVTKHKGNRRISKRYAKRFERRS